jgi:uncharacterized membrane protein
MITSATIPDRTAITIMGSAGTSTTPDPASLWVTTKERTNAQTVAIVASREASTSRDYGRNDRIIMEEGCLRECLKHFLE